VDFTNRRYEEPEEPAEAAVAIPAWIGNAVVRQ
jgi:hypothetical protein